MALQRWIAMRSILACVGIIFLAFSTAASADKEGLPIEDAIQALESQDYAKLKEARRLLIKNPEKTRPFLYEAVLDATRPALVRLRLVEILAEVGNEETLKVLRELLIPGPDEKREENARVREEAIRTLVRLHANKGIPTSRIIYEYFETGKEDNPRVKVAIALALSQNIDFTGGEMSHSLGILREFVLDKNEDVFAAAAISLEDIIESRMKNHEQRAVLPRKFFAEFTAVGVPLPAELEPADAAIIKALQMRTKDSDQRISASAFVLLRQYGTLYSHLPQ